MEYFWQWIFEAFNTREIAAGIWLFILVITLLSWKKMRPSLLQVIQAALKWKLLLMFSTQALYLTLLCGLLSSMAIWKVDQIPSTLLWFFLSGISLLTRSLKITEDAPYFRNILKDSIAITAVFEFIIVAHTFHLAIELLLLPIFVFLSALFAYSEQSSEYQSVSRFLETIMAAIGILLLWHSLSIVWEDPGSFLSLKNGRNFILPILLTTGSIPFLYLWFCIVNFENALLRISFKQFQSRELKCYARDQFFKSFFFTPKLLNRATRQFQVLPAKTGQDVDQIIKDIRRYEAEAKNPPPIDKAKGWSPYLARDFLHSFGLRTSDFHPTHDQSEWWASSASTDLDNNLLTSTAYFTLSGEEDLVTQLKLSGSFYTIDNYQEALKKFAVITTTLASAALEISIDEAINLIPVDNPFAISKDDTLITSYVKPYPTGKGFYWDISFTRPPQTTE